MTKRFSPSQILKILDEYESGIMTVEQLCQSTIYKWRNKYAGMSISELIKLKSLEEENRRLKMLAT